MHDPLHEQLARLGIGEAIAGGQLSIVTEDTPEPIPTTEEIEATLTGAWNDLFSMIRETELSFARADIAWGFVHIFHRALEKAERRWDEAGYRVRELLDRQDGSEIATSELETATEMARAAEASMDACETMREIAADLYARETGRSWQPLSGNRLRHRDGETSAMVEGRTFLRARAERRTRARAPEGTPVVFAGGRLTITDSDATAFIDNLFGTLDKVRERVPDMLLVHGGDAQGVDRFAASWADSRGVPQIVFHLERRFGKRAGFVRAERMLNLRPRCVVALAGSGVLERLVEMAHQRKIPVVDRRGPLCTRPQQAERAA